MINEEEKKAMNNNSSDNELDIHDSQDKKGLKEDLIKERRKYSVNKKTGSCTNFCSKIFPCFKKVDTTSKRIVYFNNKSLNITNWPNVEQNNKYNVITFLPVVLFNQFKQFGNFFYLLMSISQFFPNLQVGFLFTYISPLAFVVFVSMAKELYDDINRHIQDKRTNSTQITVLSRGGGGNTFATTEKNASDLEVGDIIELKKNKRVPADIIVLKTFNESNDNQSFIRTDQLDGETDWKLRKIKKKCFIII